MYIIQCKDCNIGEIGKRLAEHTHEHQLAVRRPTENFLISQHMNRLNYSFSQETVSFLDQVKSKNKREAWHSDNRHP